MFVKHRLRLALVGVIAGSIYCGVNSVRAQTGAISEVARARAAHGNAWVSGEITDWVCQGQLTMFNVKGPAGTFEVTLLRKGKPQVLRIIKQGRRELRQGSDGTRNWESFGGLAGEARGRPLQFIESQTVRSIQTLLNYQVEGMTVREQGTRGAARIIEAEDRRGRKTSYFIDDATSLITRLEFVIGQSQDMLSKKIIPRVDAFVFSDYRLIQGVQTPFKIERYTDGFKTEEMRFSSVRYNASVQDSDFRP